MTLATPPLQPGCCWKKSLFLTGLLSVDTNTPQASINWASVWANVRCQNRSIQSEEGKGSGKKEVEMKRENRRKCSNSSCVSLTLQAGTQPGSDKGMAFLHILPCSCWHSSAVIGYLEGKSCIVHNDFLSPFPELCCLPVCEIFDRRAWKGLYIFKQMSKG